LYELASTSAAAPPDVEARQQTAEQKRDVAMWWVGTVCAAVIVASVVIAWSHYRAVTVPVARLTRAAQELAVGRFDGRVAASGGPRELVELARQFDRMADELHSLYTNLEDRVQQTGRQLVRSEHLAGLGTLAAGVAHEINNPLGIIAGYAQMMTRAHDDGRATVESFKAPAGVIVDEAFRCKRIVERLLTFSRVGAGPRARVDLAEVARGVVTSLRDSGTTGERGVELDLQPAGVFAVVDEVKQVVMNLILNAIEATRPDGKIQVVTRAVGENVECVVRDDGAGMDAGTIARATEPFFSDRRGKHQTSADGVRGTGLGLSICDAIVRAHGGSITLTSDGPGRGTSVTVHLPAVVEGAV